MAKCSLNHQTTAIKAFLWKKDVFAVLPTGFFAFEHKIWFKSVQFITVSVLEINNINKIKSPLILIKVTD